MTWGWLFVLALSSRPVVAGNDLSSHLSQAELFVKRKWFEDAEAELRLALEQPDASGHYKLHMLAAQVAWEVLDIPWAIQMAQGAADCAGTDREKSQALGLLESLQDRFGGLDVVGPYEGMASRLQLELESVVFDPELKRYINRVATKWRERTPLPASISLPVGRYRINGVEAEVIAGERTTVTLPMKAIGSRGLAALQVTRAEVAPGVAFFVSESAAHMLPSPHVELSITQPVGRLLIGGTSAWTSNAYQGEHAVTTGQITWSGGARLGTQIWSAAPLAVRPSLMWRYGSVPGIPYDCTAGTDQWSCGPADRADPYGLRVYAVGRVHFAGAELSVDYREAGRTTAIGTGVKLCVEQAIGSVPAESRAEVYGDPGSEVVWTTEDQRWMATGVRMLTNLSVAF